MTAESATKELVAHGRRLMMQAQKTSERADAAAEVRSHIRLTLVKLSPYDPRYQDLLTKMEQGWL